jgi:hypothetical protein
MKNTIVTLLAALIFSSTAFADIKCDYVYFLAVNGDGIASRVGKTEPESEWGKVIEQLKNTIKINQRMSLPKNSTDADKFYDTCNFDQQIKENGIKATHSWVHTFTLTPATTQSIKQIKGVDGHIDFAYRSVENDSNVVPSEENPIYTAHCYYTCIGEAIVLR